MRTGRPVVHLPEVARVHGCRTLRAGRACMQNIIFAAFSLSGPVVPCCRSYVWPRETEAGACQSIWQEGGGKREGASKKSKQVTDARARGCVTSAPSNQALYHVTSSTPSFLLLVMCLHEAKSRVGLTSKHTHTKKKRKESQRNPRGWDGFCVDAATRGFHIVPRSQRSERRKSIVCIYYISN